ncbi:sugar ABC transporter substrate-binding protein [Paenibacillus sp. J2TS4]|uniref:ABC transporter substrate-binding protein n=1 Tax=Paenibacillus sp. J2TS4 TaxID=2807194 RepID=UPI001B2DF241|nr:sugar ABC transporter substrate-binding protein [Paenibacillus sp. J2TS4]GIP33026.1 sugar ABC transporter substrate-binding protein [Paenibacillus sp. J2TS4]
MVIKKSKWLVMLVALMLLVSACGGGGGGSAKPSGEGDGKGASAGDKKIAFWTISLSPTFDDYINGVIKDFEAQNPGVKVEWQDIPYDNVEQRTLTAAASGQLADVLNLNTDYLKKLSALGAVANMDELLPDAKKDFFDGVWTSGQFEGKTFALPWYLSNAVILYNKELLAEAGYDHPPATEEEAWEMSAAIKEKTGFYGHSIKDIHLYLPRYGINIVSDDFRSAAFNTPETVEIFKKFKERYDAGLIPEEILLGQAKIPEWYAQEKLAFWGTGPQLFRQVEDLSPEVYKKSAAASSLVGSTGESHVAIMNIAVSEKSKHKEEAAKFAQFITNADNQLAFSKIVAVLPSVKAAAEDPFFTEGENSEDPAERGRFLAAKQLEKSVDMLAPVENVSQINKTINEEFHKVLLQGKDPAQAVADAEAEVNRLLNQ